MVCMTLGDEMATRWANRTNERLSASTPDKVPSPLQMDDVHDVKENGNSRDIIGRLYGRHLAALSYPSFAGDIQNGRIEKDQGWCGLTALIPVSLA